MSDRLNYLSAKSELDELAQKGTIFFEQYYERTGKYPGADNV